MPGINGFAAADFTARAFDSNGNLLGSQVVSLNDFTTAGDIGHITFAFGDSSEIVINSGQNAGEIDFATDTWSWDTVATPEPASLLLLSSGLLTLWSQRKRILN